MPMTLTMTEAAASFGISNPLDENSYGDALGASGEPTDLNVPFDFIINTSGGFELDFTVRIESEVDAIVDSVVVTHGSDLVWSASGGVDIPIDDFSFDSIFPGPNNAYNGNSSDNTFTERAIGGDTFNGNGGIDTVVFNDVEADYWISNYGGHGSVTHWTGPVASYMTTINGIERLQFSDVAVAYDIDGNAGQAYRLYQAAFDRKPDLGGLGFQINALDTGLTLEQVAGNFIASPEFQSKYGNVDDTQFLTLLYQNVLHREPDGGGLQFHLDEMHVQGQSRAMELVHFSESPENQANVIGGIQQGITYIALH